MHMYITVCINYMYMNMHCGNVSPELHCISKASTNVQPRAHIYMYVRTLQNFMYRQMYTKTYNLEWVMYTK